LSLPAPKFVLEQWPQETVSVPFLWLPVFMPSPALQLTVLTFFLFPWPAVGDVLLADAGTAPSQCLVFLGLSSVIGICTEGLCYLQMVASYSGSKLQ